MKSHLHVLNENLVAGVRWHCLDFRCALKLILLPRLGVGKSPWAVQTAQHLQADITCTPG